MMMDCCLLLVLLGCFGVVVASVDAQDGVAVTPPMGWRSWNFYGGSIDQDIMQRTARVMTMKRDDHGKPDEHGYSLKDLGYVDIGLDDNWQACKSGVSHSFHDEKGNPLINKDKFPDMKGMVDYIHRLGLRAGFYLNNCICAEHVATLWGNNSDDINLHYVGDVNYTIAMGFDSVKLDNCGAFRDLDTFYDLFQNMKPSKRPMTMIENCHWGLTIPTLTHCPYHMYRTGGDIRGTWESMFSCLQHTRKYQTDKPLSRPGCWAYPDMLEVGNGHLETFEENRAHFGAWVIVSSPLILGFELVNEERMEEVWPIIANREAIAINQDWAGHPGRLVKEVKGKGGKTIQIWGKPLSGKCVAVFFLNNNDPSDSTENDSVSVTLKEVGAESFAKYTKKSVWTGKETQSDANHVEATLGGHDSVLLKLCPHSFKFETLDLFTEDLF